MQFTVYFENPFWVGVFEREEERGYSVCRVVLGGEPTDVEVNNFILENFHRLQFSAPTPRKETAAPARPANPKRVQREALRAMAQTGISSKAQEALRLEREQQKKQRQVTTRQQREEEEQRRFQLKQEKRKKKKKGH